MCWPINRIERIGPVTLYLGDMREVLPLLDERADLMLSDPPYLITAGGNSTGVMGGIFAKDRYDNSGKLFDMVEWEEMAPVMYDACAKNADLIIMASDREECKARTAFERLGAKFHRLLVWDKITATPNRWFMPNCEFGLYLYKGKARRINDCGSKALIRCAQVDETGHQTEKPVPLLRSWIENTTNKGDLVIDPFFGSGSSLVAAAQAGRRAIGIELKEEWFEAACKRVRAALDRPAFDFADNAPTAGAQGALAV